MCVMRLMVNDVTMKEAEKDSIKKKGIDMEIDEVEEDDDEGTGMVFMAR